jgi:hypothetical protein
MTSNRDIVSKRDKAKTLTRRDVGFQHITPPAPDSSKELATLIEVLIRKNPSPVMGVVRVLNMFRCALGGTIPPNPALPETGECAAKLSNLLQDQRYEHLQALYDQFEFHLLPPQRDLISYDLEQLKNQNVNNKMMAGLTITRLAFFIDQEIMRINK